MTRPAHLQPVGDVELPEYPIAFGERLDSHYYFQFPFDRWLRSDLVRFGEHDVQGVAIRMWCESQREDPVGSLPKCPRKLAAIANVSLEEWERLNQRSPGPLDGWKECHVPGLSEVRLMHPIVTEITVEAFGASEDCADRREADKERQALTRLRKAVVALGKSELSNDEMYIVRLHQWLSDAYPTGYRTSVRILEGMIALGTLNLR